MKEKDFQTEFGKRNRIHGVFELKFCKGKSLPFKNLAEHQEKALLDASEDGLYHKITDQPVYKDSRRTDKGMRFIKPKPFDCFFLKKTYACVVIMFWVPRKHKMVYLIQIKDFIRMRKEACRKSITEAMAIDYCEYSFDYMKY